MSEPVSEAILDAPNHYPPWAPRIWTGLLPHHYWEILSENRFAIHPERYPMTGIVSCCTLFNVIWSAAQRILLSAKIKKTELVQPPIFIVGHWRSGTTLLHELMSLDENLAYPSNFDAFVPNHFLVSGAVVRPLIKALLPAKRPMDDMNVDVDSPQEDDFALMILGAHSHYRRMGFPNNDNDYYQWLDANNLSPQQSEFLRQSLVYFYKALTYKYKKRLVLKSPPHTGRIASLVKWFPGCKFVHISRHPHKVVPSSMRLWKIADDVHAFHRPKYDQEQLFHYVNQCQETLYQAYFRDRQELSDDQLIEVQFEDLVSSPEATISSIYQKLNLTNVDKVVHSTREYFQRKQNHKKNKLNVDSLVNRIDQHWQPYMESFGYNAKSSSGQVRPLPDVST